MQGILFDLPHVAAGSHDILARAGVTDRRQVVSGSLFEAVPSGVDAYLLKSVIHDWDDDQAIAILKACRVAMTPGSRLLLVERVVRPGNEPDPAKQIDIIMLVINGGRERTVAEFEHLLAAAGASRTHSARARR